MTGPKLLTLQQVPELRARLREKQQRLVLCHGHFNVIHPGHLRFLRYAKQQGDYLLIAVMHLKELSPSVRERYFDQQSRAQGVCALDVVDGVVCLDGTLLDALGVLAPDVLVKGQEFEQHPELMSEQVKAVERLGGRVLFGSGEVQYASAELGTSTWRAKLERNRRFIDVCGKHRLDASSLLEKTRAFDKVKLMVVGDTIVDQFISCDVLGVSAEAPVMTIRELEAQEFVGGAAIVALHAQALGAACTYVSVIGDDVAGGFIQQELGQAGVAHLIQRDPSRPTTYKIRYLVDNQKLLRVSRLRQHALSKPLEDALIDRVAKRLPGMDGVIISDFVYGVVTPRVLEAILELAARHQVKLFGDLQCSSQTGDASRFKNVTLVTPTEKEARIALGDQVSGIEVLAQAFLAKTNAQNLALKLGADGLVTYTPHETAFRSAYFPALEPNPVDVSGAGDALLASMAVAMCSGVDVVAAAALGTCAAAVAVSRVGNLPVTREEIVGQLEYLQQTEAQYSI